MYMRENYATFPHSVADEQPPVPYDAAAFDEITAPLGWTLRPYQHTSRQFMQSRRGSLLADCMRAGKTAMAVSAHDMSDGPLVVIGPLATREVWNSWFARRWPDVDIVNVIGRRYDANVVLGAKLIFAHYDILPAWQSLAAALKPGTLVFDECHLLSKKKAHRTQSALAVATFAKRVIGITGTPLWNKPVGLWPMLACMNPGAWGKQHDFAVRYSSRRPGSHGPVDGEPSNVDEFKLRMSDVMLRRTWADIAPDLPPIERAIVNAEITEEESYEVECAAEQVRDSSRARTSIGDLARYRRLIGGLKVTATVRRACEILRDNERVVIWTWHRELARQIADQIDQQLALPDSAPSLAIDGKTQARKREEFLDTWRNGPVGALVMTMGVGQVGIDLSAASHAIFAEVDFTPAIVAQAEMRTFSPVQSMHVDFVVLDHAVDRKLIEILVEKCRHADIMGTPAADTAIEMLGSAFKLTDKGDMDRLMTAVLGQS